MRMPRSLQLLKSPAKYVDRLIDGVSRGDTNLLSVKEPAKLIAGGGL